MHTLASFSDFSCLHAADITCHAAWNGTLRCENLGTKAENPYVTVTYTGKCRQLASVCCWYVYVDQMWPTITVCCSQPPASLPTFYFTFEIKLESYKNFSSLILSSIRCKLHEACGRASRHALCFVLFGLVCVYVCTEVETAQSVLCWK